MGLCGWISIYWTQSYISYKWGRFDATVSVARQKARIKISILLIRAICCILPKVCPNFPFYYISDLWRSCPVNGSTAINSFSYVGSVLKGLSAFLNFPFGNQSLTSSMMWPVW